MEPNIEKLYTKQDIDHRLRELASVISADYINRPISIIVVLNGAFLFAADLLRYLPSDTTIDFVGVSTYRGGTTSRDIKVTKELSTNFNNRHVILIEDILDSGKTLSWLALKIKDHQPASFKTCVLLDKPGNRVTPYEADYVAFTIENYFVVGYGMDWDEKYRGLDYIGIVK